MSWKRLAATLLVIAIGFGIDFGVNRWLVIPEFERCYSRVAGGMTIAQVRQAMGRDEDGSTNRRTIKGEFERSWTFEESVRLTVVFDRNGVSIYKEFAPSYCGVTPLGLGVDERGANK